MDKAIASEEWPEPSGPKANTGVAVGRILNRDAPSLVIAPIVVRAGSIEYELVDLASVRWLMSDRLVARTSSTSNLRFIQRSIGPRQGSSRRSFSAPSWERTYPDICQSPRTGRNTLLDEKTFGAPCFTSRYDT